VVGAGAGFGAVAGAAVDAPVGDNAASNWAFTAGEILSAFFNNTLTCHIWVSLRRSPNPGMPVMRIPLLTFQ